MEIGEVIRKYRKEKNMTQEEMAKRLGITAPAVKFSSTLLSTRSDTITLTANVRVAENLTIRAAWLIPFPQTVRIISARVRAKRRKRILFFLRSITASPLRQLKTMRLKKVSLQA